ncbi:hypothetical protein INR49_003235 [Caranx melampygus]|nr:hypothetical protein INR49_003235 [Caranx melampygus]
MCRYLEDAAPLLPLGLEARVPVEALDDEDVLEDELQQAEKGVGQLQVSQRSSGPKGQCRHQGEVGDGELAQSRCHQEDHVQATGRVVTSFMSPPLQPVDQHPNQGAQGHDGHDGQMVAVKCEEGGEAELLLAHPHLVQYEDRDSSHEDQAPEHEAVDDPTLVDHTEGQLLGAVVTRVHPVAHVLPHDVDHAAGHQVELHVEGVEDLEAFPEHQAVTAFSHSSRSAERITISPDLQDLTEDCDSPSMVVFVWADSRLLPGPHQVPQHPDQTDPHQQQHEDQGLLVPQALGVEGLTSHQSGPQQDYIHPEQTRDQAPPTGDPDQHWIQVLVLILVLVLDLIVRFISVSHPGGVQLCGSRIRIHADLVSEFLLSLLCRRTSAETADM